MSGLDQALEALSLSGTTQVAVASERLSTDPLELARSQVESACDQNAPVDERETALKALRSCRVAEGCDLVLSRLPPLLLDPTPSLRAQAASCLLQYLSSASTQLAQSHAAGLASTVARALAQLAHQLASAPSSVYRFASTCIRVLNTLVLKASLSVETIDTIAITLGTWCYFDVPGSRTPAPIPARGRTPASSQLAFGVMGSFAPTAPTRRRKGSDASIASSRASSTGRDGTASESEDGPLRADRRQNAARIRLDALTCLRSLALAYPKALHRHWSLFLADSPYVRSRSTLISLVEHDPSRSVRLQACAALEALLQDSAAYLAIAEDSSNKTSFTSLSTKVGETVAELHNSLAQLLTRPSLANEPDLHLSLLKLSAKLAGSAPYGRMQRPLAQQIAKAVVPSVEDANNEIAASAASTLNVIFTRYMSTGSKSYFETENLAGLACSLAGVKRSVELQTAAWIMFAALVPALPLQDWSSLVTTLSHVFDILAPPAKAAQARFLAALSRLPPEALPLPPAYVDCLFFALTSREAPVRVAAYEALPGPALARHLAERRAAEADDAAPFNPWRPAVVFAGRDTDDAARQAAIRTIGLLAKAEHARPPSRETLRDAVAVLVDALRADKASASAERGPPGAVTKSPFEGTPGQIDRGGTAWALANCCDALDTTDAELFALPTLLNCAVELAQETSNEQVCVSALRMIGSIVKVAAQEAIFKKELLSDCTRTVQSGLSHTLSKIRWNAAIAASSILHPSVGLPVSSRDDLVSSLAATLVSDSSYKVRIHAVNALLAASAKAALPEADDLASRARDLADKVRKDSKEGDVPVREKTHADLLVKRLEALNQRLTQAVTEHVQ